MVGCAMRPPDSAADQQASTFVFEFRLFASHRCRPLRPPPAAADVRQRTGMKDDKSASGVSGGGGRAADDKRKKKSTPISTKV